MFIRSLNRLAQRLQLDDGNIGEEENDWLGRQGHLAGTTAVTLSVDLGISLLEKRTRLVG